MKDSLKRRKYITGANKIHTSIYLLPRHRAHLEFLMHARGQSMTDCLCDLIEQSIKSFKIVGQR